MKDQHHRLLALVLSVLALAGVVLIVRLPSFDKGHHAPVVPYTPPVPKAEASPVTVTFASPQGDGFNPQGAPTIVATFSQAMVPLAQVGDNPPGPRFQFDPPLPGHSRWIGSHTLTFIPDHLPYATHYTVTLAAGLVSEDGGTLKQAYSFSFDTQRPAVTANWAGGEASHVGPGAIMFLNFNQPVQASALKSFVQLTGTDAAKHAAPIAVDVRVLTDDELKKLHDEAWPKVPAAQMLAVVPAAPLPLNTDFTLLLRAGFPGAEGPLGAAADDSIAFSTYGPMKYVSVHHGKPSPVQPEDGVDFSFSNSVKVSDLLKHMTFDPAVHIPADIDNYDDSDVLVGVNLKANTTYHFKIDGDLKDVYGQTIVAAASGEFKTGHFRPWLSVKEGLWSLKSAQPHQVPVGLVNLHTLDLGTEAMTADTVVPLLQTMDRDAPPTQTLHAWGGVEHDDVVTWKNLNLDPVLNGKHHGLVWVQIADATREEGRVHYHNTLVAVTNLGITLKTSPENTHVWVTSLSQGIPVAGAKVQLRDAGNRVLWQGTSDKDGLALAPGWKSMGLSGKNYEVPTLYALATQDDDLAVTHSGMVDTWAFDIPANPSGIYPNSECFMFTERGLYRAGEDVNFKGMYRQIRNGQWTVKSGLPLHLTFTSARGDKVATTNVKTDDYGTFSYTLHLAANAPTGDWSVTATTSVPQAEFRNDFQVQAFKPVTFEVKVDAGQPFYRQGEALKAKVAATYLFGAPVQNGDVTWTLSLSNWSSSWSDLDGFRFGRDEWLEQTAHGFSEAGEGEESEQLFARGQTKLSGDGTLPVDATLTGDKLPADNKTITVEADVEAPGHRQVSGRASVSLFAGDFTVGLKPQTDFIEAGKPDAIDVVTVTPEGKVEAGHTVHIRLMRREWDSVRHDPSAVWDTQPRDTEIHSQDVLSGDKPVTATLTPTLAGFYYLEATSHDNSAHTLTTTTTLWVYGGDYVAWSRGDEDRINLVADKKHYKPGDTARIMVQNPYEDAYALITTERELVLQHRVEKLHGSAPIIEIPLDEKDLPNVYVSVVLIAGRKGVEPKYDAQGDDVARPSFKLGYVNLPVDATQQQLKVSVSTDHPRYGPGDTVTVNLQLQDSQGKPVEGDVALAAVDKGVLNLIGYQTQDPFTDFYGSRSLAVQTSETRSFILGSHKTGEKGAPGGGGGKDLDGLLNVRKNFKMTAYWNPSVRTDASGKAQVQFKLPDNLSSFRVMAVASTRTSQFGSAQGEFLVNKPLVMTASIPRFVTVGDTFSGGVTVTNNTPERQNVTVRATVTGLTLQGTAEKTVDVAAQGTREVLFDYLAPAPPADGSDPAPADMVYAGTMGSDQDNLEVNCPLKTPKVLEAVATAGDTDKSDHEDVTVPVSVWSGTSRLEVGMASTALVSLRSAVQSLVKYPYGCLEQKVSRVYPMILGEQLASQFALPNFDAKLAHAYVESFIAEFPSFQKSSGGCSLWGSATDDENPFASAYAFLVLTQAGKHGYEVPQQNLDALRSYVSELLTLEDAGWHWPYSKADRLSVQCLALYGLALSGEDVSGSINHMFDQRKNLSLSAQAWLARAMAARGGFQQQEQVLATHFQQDVQLDPTNGYVETADVADSDWIYKSRVRTTALVLSALLETNHTEHTPDLMRWLLKHTKAGEWFGTQENAWALDAAFTYLKKMEHDEPNFTASVTLDGKPVASETFKGRTTRVSNQSIALDDAASGKDLPLNLDVRGQGRLYYTLRLFYSPKDGGAWARDEGLAVDKHVTDLDGKEPADLKAGQVYLVTVTVVSPRERTFVVVDDPVPAGFEVVNTNFETESQALAHTLNKAQDKDAQQDGTWFGSFNHWEIYDDKVLLFADQLQPGTHRFTYLARAMYPGSFWQGSTRAEAMYEPETFGGTAAAHVTVTP